MLSKPWRFLLSLGCKFVGCKSDLSHIVDLRLSGRGEVVLVLVVDFRGDKEGNVQENDSNNARETGEEVDSCMLHRRGGKGPWLARLEMEGEIREGGAQFQARIYTVFGRSLLAILGQSS